MIGDIKKFRFWCQKVIPLVYDNSLSYYEVLCKVVDYLNKVIEDVNEIPSYIDAKIDEALDDEHLKELLEQFIVDIEAAISSNNEHDNTNSSADYNIGQMLWWNGKLYKVIRQIDAGDTFIVDTNIELVNFEDLFNSFINEIKYDITANDDDSNATASQSWEAGTWLWLNDVLYTVISDIAEGNAYVFTGENANVRHITIEEMLIDEATARENADTEISTALGEEVTAREEAVAPLRYLEKGYVSTKNFDDVQDAVEYAHENNINVILMSEDRVISRPIELYDDMIFDGCNHILSSVADYASPRLITNYDSYITNNDVYQKFDNGSTDVKNSNITIRNIVIGADWHQSFNGMINPYPRGPLAFDSVDGLIIENVSNNKIEDEITIWCTRCNEADVSNCNIETTLTVAGGCVWFFGDTISGTNVYKNLRVHDCVLKSAKDEPVYFSATYGSIDGAYVDGCNITGDQLSVTAIGKCNHVDIHDNVIEGGYIKLGNMINNAKVHDNVISGSSSTYLGIFTQPQDASIKGANIEVCNNIFNIGASVAGSAVSLRYFSNVTISDNLIEMLNTTYQTIDLRNTATIKVSDNKIKGVRFAYIEGSNTYPTIISGNVFESIDNTRSALEFGAGALAFVKIMNNKFYSAGACIANEGGNFEGNFFVGNTCNNCSCLFSLNALLSATSLTDKSIMKDNLVLGGALYIDTLSSGTIANDTRIVKFNNYVYVPDGTSTPTWTLTS